MTIENIEDKTAIIGIGVVDSSTNIGKSEWSTACLCIKLAADDAGIDVTRIDGMAKNVDDGPDVSYVQKGLGIDNLTYASEAHWGSSAMMNAVSAVAAGTVNYCVYYVSAHRASGPEKSISDYRVAKQMRDDSLDLIRYDFYAPFGLIGEPGFVAMMYKRYMHEAGVKPKQLGYVSVVASENAAKNPKAVLCDKPITIDDYLGSKIIADPIRELDVAKPIDAAMAIIVASVDTAKSLKQDPVLVSSVASATALEGQFHTSYTRDNIVGLPEMENMAKDLYGRAGLTAKDINVALLDDTFVPYVPLQLEALGFCSKGEGPAFIEGGANIRVGGKLPISTSGGAIGEGKFDMARIVEAVRQIRGTSPNQVDGVNNVLVTSGAGGPADGIILRKN